MHDRIILLRVNVWVHKTSLTPPLHVELPVLSNTCEPSCINVLRVTFSPLSTISWMDFLDILTVRYFLFPFLLSNDICYRVMLKGIMQVIKDWCSLMYICHLGKKQWFYIWHFYCNDNLDILFYTLTFLYFFFIYIIHVFSHVILITLHSFTWISLILSQNIILSGLNSLCHA